jgi:hypothetical protein
MPYVVLAFIGFVWGLLIGRWWATVAALGRAVWIAQVSEVDEVPPWFLGLVYGVVSLVCIAGGVAARHARHGNGSSPGS